ncbi:hypothetical protein Kfla_1979 [Kribbella flavida DSM 17836]|uniref:Uncharacterized protein n=1 Tax=Kribbella flavida (strain DSM 17836 / JCM 10339 / NBRC 14399) TaxID=479435 RepID=D2PQT8_KRIFD|nr:hypothetical protein [Kribbella flavida]ADB31071.1 hypothetical protein Kfla_1979 [Kribbella flavida DSM 17836]
MTTTDSRSSRAAVAPSKLTGYVAATMAAGLGLTHLTIYTVGYLSADDVAFSTYLFSGVAVTAVALLFAAAAALSAREVRRMRRTLRVMCWIAAVVLSLQAVAIAVGEPSLLIEPAGPGPWSLVGGPAFAIFAWRARTRATA